MPTLTKYCSNYLKYLNPQNFIGKHEKGKATMNE